MHRFARPALAAACAATAVMVVTPAEAQFAKPEDAIKYRQSAMFLMNTHVGRIFAMANGRLPFDAKAVADNAEIAATVSKWQFHGFVEGSEGGNALPKVWKEMDKFKSNAAKSNEDIAKLAVAAKEGSIDAVKAAVGEVGRSCKACHDSYRKD